MNYKVFESGETLTANDVMTYFMDQVVVQVPTEAELADLANDHENVRVAYAEDTDKVYVLDDGTWKAFVTDATSPSFNNLTVTGNLTVQGTTTTIDSTTIAVKDKFVFEGLSANDHETTLQVEEPTADRTVTIPDATTTLVGTDVAQTLTNKTINASNNTITNVSLSTGVTGTLPIANGGTGQTTATAATNALLPSQTSNSGKYLTTNGTDTSWGTVNQYSLPSQTGNSGKFLTTDGTAESWGTVDLTTKTDKSTLTTTGDIYYASSANTPARLGIGSTNQVLTVSGGIPSWATPSSPAYVGVNTAGLRQTTLVNGATSYALNMNVENFNTDNFHNNSTNNTRITIPSGKGGKYLVTCRLTVDNATGSVGYVNAFLRKNGSGTYNFTGTNEYIFNTSGGITGNNSNSTLNLAHVVAFNAGDYFEFIARTDNGNGQVSASAMVTCTYLGA